LYLSKLRAVFRENPALLPPLSHRQLTTILVIEFLDIIHCPVSIFEYVLETGLLSVLMNKPTKLGPIDKPSSYFQTPKPTQDKCLNLGKKRTTKSITVLIYHHPKTF
jgi:hypothetical protein